jgi:hypothetical protein
MHVAGFAIAATPYTNLKIALREHFHAFLMAYNFAKRLKPLRELTPYEYICQWWQKESERFTTNPSHHTLGLNT